VAEKKTPRKALSPDVRLKVWVRSGGRCVVCNRYLLEGKLSGREVTFGELAHIVGQAPTAESPRGLDDLDPAERDDPDNLVLVCEDEHVEIDKRGTRDLFAVDLLKNMKRAHEGRIRHVTSFAEDRSTVVLRVIGQLRGASVEVGTDAIASAVIRSAGRFPRFELAFDRRSVEIDLRDVPGEAEAATSYYEQATATIEDVVDHKLHEGVARDAIQHLSVFAFARVPLLVHLGSCLDDTVPTDIYQRHRSTGNWEWPDEEPVSFELDLPESQAAGYEAVLVLNVSGSIAWAELPDEIRSLPRFVLAPSSAVPSPDLVSSANALAAFEASARTLLARIEATHKTIRRLHVFAAVPLSAAVTLGRVRANEVHPALLLYDRGESGYHPALEIGKP
jgi:hypothetical protein